MTIYTTGTVEARQVTPETFEDVYTWAFSHGVASLKTSTTFKLTTVTGLVNITRDNNLWVIKKNDGWLFTNNEVFQFLFQAVE